MKSIFNAAMFAAILFTAACGASAQEKPKGKPWPAPDEAISMKNPLMKVTADTVLTNGKELYALNCKSCHGLKGKGDGTKAAQIEIQCGDFTSEEFAKETDGTLFWKMTEGRKPMPGFKEKLTDEERWEIICYIRTFAVTK